MLSGAIRVDVVVGGTGKGGGGAAGGLVFLVSLTRFSIEGITDDTTTGGGNGPP